MLTISVHPPSRSASEKADAQSDRTTPVCVNRAPKCVQFIGSSLSFSLRKFWRSVDSSVVVRGDLMVSALDSGSRSLVPEPWLGSLRCVLGQAGTYRFSSLRCIIGLLNISWET